MSHFVVVALVEADVWGQGEDAVHERIAALMAPFDEALRTEPRKEYMAPDDLERMVRHYGADRGQPAALVPYLEDWDGAPGGHDEGGLYVLRTDNPGARFDWYRVGGRWDGDMLGLGPLFDPQGGFNFGDEFQTLERNACPVRRLRNDWAPFAVVGPSGWAERGTMGWWGHAHEARSPGAWTCVYTEILSAHPTFWAVSLDVHV